MPDVSVIMPVLNAGVFLQPAIESVLAQSGPTLELITVDNGSTDGSRELAEGFDDARVRAIRHHPRKGLGAALNVGLQAARGEFIARLDADDLARPGRLARQVDLLRRMPRVMLVGSRARLIDASGAPIGTVERPCDLPAIRWYNLLDNAFIHSAVMFRRREVLDEFGGYDESLPLAEDWALWGRILSRYDGCNLPEALVDYRFSPGSIMGAIESSPAHPRRAELYETIRPLIGRHIDQTIGAGAVSPPDVDLLTGFVLGVDANRVGDFLAVFERILNAFLAGSPQARDSSDLARTLAGQFDAIAFRLTPSRRQAVLSVYAAALRHGSSVARFLPWGRAVALAAFGRSGRDRLRDLRNAARMAKTA